MGSRFSSSLARDYVRVDVPMDHIKDQSTRNQHNNGNSSDQIRLPPCSGLLYAVDHKEHAAGPKRSDSSSPSSEDVSVQSRSSWELVSLSQRSSPQRAILPLDRHSRRSSLASYSGSTASNSSANTEWTMQSPGDPSSASHYQSLALQGEAALESKSFSSSIHPCKRPLECEDDYSEETSDLSRRGEASPETRMDKKHHHKQSERDRRNLHNDLHKMASSGIPPFVRPVSEKGKTSKTNRGDLSKVACLEKVLVWNVIKDIKLKELAEKLSMTQQELEKELEACCVEASHIVDQRIKTLRDDPEAWARLIQQLDKESEAASLHERGTERTVLTNTKRRRGRQDPVPRR